MGWAWWHRHAQPRAEPLVVPERAAVHVRIRGYVGPGQRFIPDSAQLLFDDPRRAESRRIIEDRVQEHRSGRTLLQHRPQFRFRGRSPVPVQQFRQLAIHQNVSGRNQIRQERPHPSSGSKHPLRHAQTPFRIPCPTAYVCGPADEPLPASMSGSGGTWNPASEHR